MTESLGIKKWLSVTFSTEILRIFDETEKNSNEKIFSFK
ncbi:hypothetical protein NCDO763_1391 [Lactococcus cremoris]|jgi:hypothetical protein|nr:hypothetical protein V4_0489 [Lactococcus cremoris]KZK34215.1 hypothetical protein N41_2261 [Lactococcus cremoris]KZK51265.1 hypothetical protein NCDO763_1391 [Lactococcus cremoris]